MSGAKPFIADATREKNLVLAYLRFPEISEVFLNIVRNRPVTENVLSEWDPETLESHIREFILPQLHEAGAIRKSLDRLSGYATDYADIHFTSLSCEQMAAVASKRADLIGRTVSPKDSLSEVLTANLHFQSLPDGLRSELMENIRTILNKYIDAVPGTNDSGSTFRLALVARAEK